MRKGNDANDKHRGSKQDELFVLVGVYVGVYEDRDDAVADYQAVKDLHSDGVVGTYDAAIVGRDQRGKVHVMKHETPTQHGAWSGLGIGALLGLVFPPGAIAGGIIGATAGGLIGHFREGMSRSDLKQLGDLLATGECALAVIGQDRLERTLATTMKRTTRTVEKQMNADNAQFGRELDKEIDQELQRA
jgi:uncharacterized membrane protein